MENFTPEQKANLETWAGQRDTLLSDISNLKNQKEKLEEVIKNAVDSYTNIETSCNQVLGRIIELRKKEEELPSLISKEIAGLQSQKNVLESEIENLTKLVGVLKEQKSSLEKDVSLAISNFDILKSEAMVLDKIVDHVTTVSEKNSNEINNIVSDLKISLKDLIDINQKNVTETNQVLDKLPRMLVELQKTKLIKNKI